MFNEGKSNTETFVISGEIIIIAIKSHHISKL